MKAIRSLTIFVGAVVASVILLFGINFAVDAIMGSPASPSATDGPSAGETPRAEPEKQATTKETTATKDAAPTVAVVPPSAPASEIKSAPEAKVVDLKKHPGRKIYLRKGACAACHGRNGQRAISYYPTVAGQDKKYIENQIKDIMNGKRKGGIDEETGHPRSEAMRGALVTADGKMRISKDDIRQMADWLSQLEPAKPRVPETPPSAKSVKLGAKLYKKCIACHGKEGKKPLKGYPYIAGQKHIYIVQQLTDIKSGARSNGKVKTMIPFVKRLSDKEIGSIADYLSQIDRTAN
jgi:cytochrome c553